MATDTRAKTGKKLGVRSSGAPSQSGPGLGKLNPEKGSGNAMRFMFESKDLAPAFGGCRARRRRFSIPKPHEKKEIRAPELFALWCDSGFVPVHYRTRITEPRP